MFNIHDAPEWTNYYKFLMTVYDFNIDPSKNKNLPLTDFDGLMRMHLYSTLDQTYTPDFYNKSNYKTHNDNFFHAFLKFISIYEKYKNMDDYILFFNTLLRRDDVYDYGLSSPNYEDYEPYECYTGYKYITHITFIIYYDCDILESIQNKYRKSIHKKKLKRSLDIIKYSPPKSVEFCNFESFPGGNEYIKAFETFSHLASSLVSHQKEEYQAC